MLFYGYCVAEKLYRIEISEKPCLVPTDTKFLLYTRGVKTKTYIFINSR